MAEFNPQPKKGKKRSKSEKNIRTKTLSDMQKLRKLQESVNGQCVCISCGRLLTVGETSCQGGHYISRQNRATELEPDNIWPQCGPCNILKKGNPIAYRYNLVNKIGAARVERLENMALAREGNQEALSKLSDVDKFKALLKKTNQDYKEEDERIRAQIKALENNWRG